MRRKQKLLTDFLSDRKGSPCEAASSAGSFAESLDSTPSCYLKKRRKIAHDEIRQYTLDAGQKAIGSQYCDKCEMVYDLDSVSDCNLHMEYHERLVKRDWFRVKYSQIDAWRKQNFCVPVEGGYLFLVNSHSKSSIRQRLEEIVLKCVNVEIGIAPDVAPVWDGFGRRQAWIYVASLVKLKFPFIAAVILVEGVTQAFYPNEQAEAGNLKVLDGWSIGVNRLWIHKSSRRCGIATRLLDIIRHHMRKDCVVPRERIAFSELTDDGEAFASKFCPYGKVLRYSLAESKAEVLTGLT